MKLNKNQIIELLPHREPMLLIDELIDIKKLKSATAIMNVKKDSFYVDGHFPGNPVFPGVLIVEALAQAACVLAGIGSLGERHDKEVLLTQIQDVRFKQPVVPGDTLYLNIIITKHRKPFYWFSGEAYVEGKVVAKATFSASIR